MRKRTKGVIDSAQDSLGSYTVTIGGRTLGDYELLSVPYHTDYQVCWDEIHPHHPREGGPFSLCKITTEHSRPLAVTGYDTGYVKHCYSAMREAVPMSSGSVPPDTLEECKGKGAAAWKKFRPARSDQNLGQFFAELRDFPSLFKFKLKKFKDLGSGYLNAQFGWAPFVADIRRFIQRAKRLDSQLERLKRQNNKWVRRGGDLYSSEDQSISDNAGLQPANYCTVDTKRRIITEKERCWFSGSFRYYIPGLSDGSWGDFRMSRKIWGLELTPALVYELIPFSWLVDWCANVGDVVDNISSMTFDHMAARTAYVMLHKEVIDRYEVGFTGRFTESGNVKSSSYFASTTITTETKARAKASPFGFETDWDLFSTFQLSILAALGITRFPSKKKTLRKINLAYV